MRHKILSIVLLFGVTVTFGQEQQLKKITIVEENNSVLNFNYKYLGLPDSINSPEFSELKEYVFSKTSIKSQNEPELFFELMEWVSKQWKHNGWHEAPDSLNSLGILKSAHNEGQEYRCVEYGVVLNDILISFGYPARTIALKHKDTDYGGAGMGHVATEVWSNKLNKWIFLDPQFGIYAKKDDTPLNIFEIFQIKSKGKYNEIEFINVADNKPNNKYGDKFLSRYLGYIDILQISKNRRYSLALKMEGDRDFLTFQAFPSGRMIFTKKTEDVYYGMNQTMVIINYNEKEIERSKKEYSLLGINSADDFNKNMSKFAAKPEFILSLDNNMPWFKNYVVKLNSILVSPENENFYINLIEGVNTIEVVAVNQNNIEGITTVIKIKYE
jgi:hypothetical protein